MPSTNLIIPMVLGCVVAALSSVIPEPRHVLHDRIVGGSVVGIEDAPYQVSLQRNGFFCGGSIIDQDWILTAAHCVQDGVRGLKIRAGSAVHNAKGSLVGVREIIVHEKYDEHANYDFALLRLEKSLRFDETTQPIDLPSQHEDIEDGTECIVSGWGSTQDVTESNLNLRLISVPIVGREECSARYVGRISDSMICAGLEEGGKDSCYGDSGGPMVCNDKLFGVVSWGTKYCAEPRSPSVYGRVTEIRDWIEDHTGV